MGIKLPLSHLSAVQKFPAFGAGAMWLAAAKAMSALFIVIQAAVFSQWLPNSETQSAFYFLAVVSWIGQAALAVPIILISQYAWLASHARARKYQFSFFVFILTLVILGGIWFFTSTKSIASSSAVLVVSTAFLAAIPNLFSVERFAVGDVKIGALFNVLNIAVPQVAASLMVLWQGTAIAWLTGLMMGHGIAVLSIFFFVNLASEGPRPAGKRPPLKFGFRMLVSTIVWLFFVWSLPNLPRITLADAQPATFVAQFLILASVSFAISNAFETLIAQLRRGDWLGWFEREDRGKCRSELIANELRWIALVALALWAPVALSLFVIGHFVLFKAAFVVPLSLVVLLVFCDLARATCSISYLITEAGRAQAKLFTVLAATTVVTSILLAQLNVSHVEKTFMLVAIVLTLCCALLSFRSVQLARP